MAGALEQHFSVPQIAKMWALSEDSIRRIFRDEPGVVRLDSPERLKKRGYLTMRIPHSVVQRVHERLRKQ
jgi:transcriptional regulator GlxA family with amidase domain